MEAWYSAPPGRAESTGGNQGMIQKNRDGVPMWSGDTSTFEEFVEACLLYEQTVVKEKRYLCGPRIASELSGSARRILIGRSADWLSFDGGVRRLVAALRAERGQSKVPEMSELLMKYFKGTRRQRGETMNDFVQRKAEAYTRAQQSMARYQRENGSTGKSATSSVPSLMPPVQRTWRTKTAKEFSSESASISEEPDEFQELDDVSRSVPANEVDEEDPWAWWHHSGDEWTGRPWSSHGWWHGSWNGSNHSRSGQHDRGVSDTIEYGRNDLPEILPDFIQGWYLFMDSGLDTMERNVLQAELRGDFSVRAVENVLRKHWTDVDIKKRDADKNRYSAHAVLEEEPEEEQACLGEWDPQGLEEQGFSSEEIACLATEQERLNDALAVIHEARQTLRDARAKQHAVKMSRQYYPVKGKGKSRYDSGILWKRLGKSPPPLQCFRCGGPHKVADCKEKPKEQSANQVVEAEAPFVFYNDLQEKEAHPAAEALVCLTTQEVMEQGKAVVDGGATRTIGSIAALSRVVELNEATRGITGVQSVDTSERPVFGFGNSSKDQCSSTASLAVPMDGKTGTLKVHALDKGVAPILLSISSLRSLGAIIDYEADMAVFRAIDPTKVVKLERTAAGHQVIPLTTDVYEGATSLTQPVPSFRHLE